MIFYLRHNKNTKVDYKSDILETISPKAYKHVCSGFYVMMVHLTCLIILYDKQLTSHENHMVLGFWIVMMISINVLIFEYYRTLKRKVEER